MIQKIRIIDRTKNRVKVIEKEIRIRDINVLRTKQKFHASTFKDKTKYTRKTKHRNKDYDVFFC